MEIKITLRNTYLQTLYIPLIEGYVDHQSTKYRKNFHLAQDMISALQIAVDSVNRDEKGPNINSAADEIIKLKSLLDYGAITFEEFQNKEIIDLITGKKMGQINDLLIY